MECARVQMQMRVPVAQCAVHVVVPHAMPPTPTAPREESVCIPRSVWHSGRAQRGLLWLRWQHHTRREQRPEEESTAVAWARAGVTTRDTLCGLENRSGFQSKPATRARRTHSLSIAPAHTQWHSVRACTSDCAVSNTRVMSTTHAAYTAGNAVGSASRAVAAAAAGSSAVTTRALHKQTDTITLARTCTNQ